MIFVSKIYLYLLVILLPLLFFIFLLSKKKYEIALKKFGDTKLIFLLMPASVKKINRIKNILLFLIFVLLILTLSDLRFGTKLVEIKQKSTDVMIAIDCSKSMLAEDIKPSRMSRAKELFSSLVDKLQGNRIGVVAFSGIAFTQCPLTFDYNAVKMLLGLIDTDLVPYPGTAIGKAVELALKNFTTKDPYSYKILILLTDGEDHGTNPLNYISDLKQNNIKVYTIGIATPGGEPIPERDETGKTVDYKKDKKGQVVVSKLDEKLLNQLALETGGFYYQFMYGESAIVQHLYNEISNIEKKEQKSKLYNLYEHRFQYPLLLAILLLFIETIIPVDVSKLIRGH